METLKPTSKILERIYQNSAAHPDEVFTRLFRYLLREDIYYAAFQKLYANDGALTKGSNEDTADGFSQQYVLKIIDSLKNGSYRATPVRRVYIRKPNGKLRPLGIPSFSDKLIQEAVRMILEAVYEPNFDNHSHGFRPNKSCHTALEDIEYSFVGVPWIIEGDITGCFDNIDHEILLGILGKKIKDSRFLHVIRQFLKAGYMEDWRYHETYSGSPQGGICSPILANIYLSELDAKVAEIKGRFEKANGDREKEPVNPEYIKVMNTEKKLRKEIGETAPGPERDKLVRKLHETKRLQLATPYPASSLKKIVYVRYADDWILGVKGSKQECREIKEEIATFLRDSLKLELSPTKTLITHSSNKVRFLGYDISIRRTRVVKRSRNNKGKTFKKRTLSGKVNLEVPLDDKIMSFLFGKGAIHQMPDGTIRPKHRNELLGKPDNEIVKTYNSEVRGILNFYGMAKNYHKLNYFCYLMEYSCLFTLAAKHKTGHRKIKRKYYDGKGWSIPNPTKTNPGKRVGPVKLAEHRILNHPSDKVNEYWHYDWKTGIRARLKRGICECCNVPMEDNGIVYVVRRMADLGDEPWERVMKEMRRKTLIVCPACHVLIHPCA